MKKAIIDIGSNTINLLIGSISDNGKLHVIHDEKKHAKLAKGGLIDGNMTEEALERGYNAIAHFHQVCLSHNLTETDINVYALKSERNPGPNTKSSE